MYFKDALKVMRERFPKACILRGFFYDHGWYFNVKHNDESHIYVVTEAGCVDLADLSKMYEDPDKYERAHRETLIEIDKPD